MLDSMLVDEVDAVEELEEAVRAGSWRDAGSVRGATRRLVHRARTWEPWSPAGRLDEGTETEEEFVLTGELPVVPPLLGDGHGSRFHDLQAAAEMVREVSEFIGQTHFAVPAERTGIFYRYAIETGDIASWRLGRGPGRLTTTMAVRPGKVIDSVPRALDFRTALEMDGVACGTATASVVFLPPVAHRIQRAQSRPVIPGPRRPGAAGAGGAGAAIRPAEVARAHPGDVLIHSPSEAKHGRLSVSVSVHGHAPVHAGGSPAGYPGNGHVPALVQLETLRQTSLLTAGRACGLAPSRSTLGSLRVNFRGYAEPHLALRCAAVAGLPGRDGQGRRQVPVALTLTQAGRAVLEAVATVVEDF
ncbi:AfsA-related hotdog domain-containing protein [Streptomyces sp. TBY4]|uniref:AfsA-related hotdog domain-containing protein n=1 Tax=Streptomyces sp. TBY4 TaxID=2962030 RepID=UPI0020B6532C|nr:AfsA-related hotdog domain-containing protein [Streptomyces sp. TBY4]MCP3760675.1 hypothetical protein [Streptomyces sp. TBY4]